MSRRVCVLLVCAIAAGCGGSATAPLAPSPASATAPSPASAASITGAVQTPAGAAAGMIVEVVGSALRTAVDGDNRFAFAGVPAGQHRLRFSGAGANAEVALDPVASGETMNVVIAVSGSSASVQSGHKIGVDETRFGGRIASIDTTAGTLVIGERTVTTSGSTVIKDGSRAIAVTALTETMLVEVTGVQSETAFAARLIDVLPDPKLNLDGTVSGLTGTAAAFEFTLGARRIVGTGSTDFKGGPNPSFARLANGDTVHVAALDKGTFAEATRINLKEDPAATPASAAGTLTAIAGTPPALTLTVGASTVVTSAATLVRRGNTVLSLAALATGQTLDVDGTLESDGTIAAAKIQIEIPSAAASGTIAALSGTSPALTLTVGTTIVTTDAATTVRYGTAGATLAALALGQTVAVTGTVALDGTVAAGAIQIEPAAASATGTLDAITGSSPALTLTIGAATVLTDASTVVRQGNLTLTPAALTLGQTLEVDGTLGLDGTTFTASRIQIQGSPVPAPAPQPAPFDAEGTVSALEGTCPAVTFTLQEKTIAVNAATHFVQVTCATLANGTTLRVKGTLQGDGTVVATMVQLRKK